MKTLRRIADSLEELERLFRIFIEEYTGRYYPTQDQVLEEVEPGLYRPTQDAIDESYDERRRMRNNALQNPYNDIDFRE